MLLKNGESLKGLIKITNGLGSSKIQFKKDKKSKKQKFGRDEVSKAFFHTSNPNVGFYEYVPILGKKKLLKIIRNEKVKLYVSRTSPNILPHNKDLSKSEIKKVYYLIRKGEVQATYIDGGYISEFTKNAALKAFKNILVDYFSDCATVVDYIENDIYQDFDIRQIVDDYNLLCD